MRKIKGEVWMDKMQYMKPEMEIVLFESEDVITASGEFLLPEQGLEAAAVGLESIFD